MNALVSRILFEGTDKGSSRLRGRCYEAQKRNLNSRREFAHWSFQLRNSVRCYGARCLPDKSYALFERTVCDRRRRMRYSCLKDVLDESSVRMCNCFPPSAVDFANAAMSIHSFAFESSVQLVETNLNSRSPNDYESRSQNLNQWLP